VTRFDPDARPDKDAESGVNSAGTTITPMEAVIDAKSSKKLHAAAELTEQIVEERAKRKSEPIHMEGLRPLPSGLPRLPNGMIPGGSDATSLVPSMRRTIPAPFVRPSVSGGRHGKTWAYLPADQVVPEDIVVDFGRVEFTSENTLYETIAGVRAAVGVEVRLVNVLDEVRKFDPSEQLRVFRKHAG